MSRNFSGAVAGSVVSVQFQIVPCSSLYFFLRSIGPFQCSWCLLQDFNLLYLSLPKQFPLFILASSVCWSLQCLISALTQGGEGGHLFRLTCSAVLWGGGNAVSLGSVGSARRVWATLGLPPLTACLLSRSTLLRPQVALQRNCLRRALGCVYFPGPSRSGSGSWVFHKGTDWVGSAFCALPRSKRLRRPGA